MTESKQTRNEKKKKEKKPGILYFSSIPQHMTVKHMREIMSQYGEIGKIFFQPDEHADRKRSKRRKYSEGWVEFFDKKKAKAVALALNGKTIGGKRSSPWYHELWTMKYLPKFRWTHLNERLEYEKMVRKQKIHTEVRQAKKEVEFYRANVAHQQIQSRINLRAQRRDRLKQKFANEFDIGATTTTTMNSDHAATTISDASGSTRGAVGGSDGLKQDYSAADSTTKSKQQRKDDMDRDWTFAQRQTDAQITEKKRKRKGGGGGGGESSKGSDEGKNAGTTAVKKARTDESTQKAADNKAFLKQLFSGGLKQKRVDESVS